MSTIIVYGVDHGKCMPASGVGFRKEFTSSSDADWFIKLQCRAAPRGSLDHYAIYITSEFCSLDRLMHFHNWNKFDHEFRTEDLSIERVDILAIKNEYDIQFQAQKQREDQAKLRIKSEVNNMSNEEFNRTKKLFEEVKLNVSDN